MKNLLLNNLINQKLFWKYVNNKLGKNNNKKKTIIQINVYMVLKLGLKLMIKTIFPVILINILEIKVRRTTEPQHDMSRNNKKKY